MQITVTIRGEPDVLPYTKKFEFQGPEDEVFVASYCRVKDMLARQQKININEALLLFSAFVVSAMQQKKPDSQIKKEIGSILSAEQVMIGVPEMLQSMDFDITVNGRRFGISITRPIPTQSYAFGPAR